MAIGSAVGQFTFTTTSVGVVASANGGFVNQVNLEGTASGYGTVLGTLSFHVDAPGATSGRTTWLGSGYLENGDIIGSSGEGVFHAMGNHKWRVRSVVQISDGTVILTDGVMSLDGRSYQGDIHQWE